MATRKIAVLTSGGDAPGMNAAIRAVTRTGLDKGWEIFGVRNGYAGMVEGLIEPLGPRDVGGILQRGGTFLGSTRLGEFKEEGIRARGLENLGALGIDGLIVIGGNGSQSGALALSRMGLEVVGVASTIDNDLAGTEITIGVDTALNIALEAIDRLRVTASSHKRAFLVEVMGRNCGYLALMAGIAGGAESVVIPEVDIDPEVIAQDLQAAYDRGKAHALIVVAEGARHNAVRLAQHFEKHRGRLGFDLRVTTLGHVQRGGTPSAFDRLLATRFAAAATDCLACGEHGRLVGLSRGRGALDAPFRGGRRTQGPRPRASQATEGPRQVISRLSERQMALLVILGGLLLYIPFAGSYGLWDPWETHYSEVARQMTHRGDFISLWWPGSPRDPEVFWSKPVLSFWLMSMRDAPRGRGAARRRARRDGARPPRGVGGAGSVLPDGGARHLRRLSGDGALRLPARRGLRRGRRGDRADVQPGRAPGDDRHGVRRPDGDGAGAGGVRAVRRRGRDRCRGGGGGVWSWPHHPLFYGTLALLRRDDDAPAHRSTRSSSRW